MKSLLIIDGDFSAKEATSQELLENGFVVQWVPTVADAESSLAAFEYDYLFVDTSIAVADDYRIINRMKEIYPTMGVFVVTAYGDVRKAIESMHHGAAGFVNKPYELSDILSTLQRTD